MTDDDRPPRQSLRERAVAIAAARADGTPAGPTTAGAVIEELRLHQIELEVQNDDLRATQAKLIEARDRYTALYEDAPVGYTTSTDEDIIVMANATLIEMLGVERQAIIGAPMSSLVLDEDQDTWYHHRRRCARARGVCELSLRRPDGDSLRVRVESVCADDDANRSILKSSISDISELERARVERRRLEERVRDAQHMESLGLLAGGIAHDFNNMLTILVGRAELALMVMEPESPAREHVQQMLLASERAAGMVEQILAYSRKVDLDCVIVHLEDVTGETLDLLRTMKPKDVVLQMEVAHDAPAVFADTTQIEQVIINLCTNAYRAMRGDAGTLTVSVERATVTAQEAKTHPVAKPGVYARLVVSDTGHGISPEILGRIFEPFFTTRNTGEGTGMGLAICYGIVAAHDGFITVDSELAVGTTFSVHLPAANDVRDRSSPSPVDDPEHGSERILVVDDQAPVLEMVTLMLESLGYRVSSFSGGVDAIAALEKSGEDWDIVLTDHSMPERDGLDVLKASRTLRQHRPVVVMTGHSDVITDADDGGVGADAVIRKPFRRSQLGRLLRHILDEQLTKDS